jgi:glutathione peroxidase
MKALVISVIVLVAVIVLQSFRSAGQRRKMMLVETTSKDLYTLSYNSIDGQEINLSDYKGKYILFVNVASKCGYTKQYEGLEELYQRHKDKMVIIGFPCNQFLGQEPGSEEEIAEFCSKNFGVTFPLSTKIAVKGKDQHPIYTWLTSKELNGVEDNKISWNFNKILVSPEGNYIAYFDSKVEPLSGEIESKMK